MEMNLYYVAEITEEISLDDNISKKEVAKFISGPFGNWHHALDAKSDENAKRIGNPNLQIVTQTIEVKVD